MDVERVRAYCLSIKGATEGFPFDETSLVFKIMGKMFALLDLEGGNKLCLKCDPDYAIELRENYPAIEQAWHFNHKYWNQLQLNGGLSDAFICELIDHSLSEVLKKMTKKARAEYAAMP